MALTPIDILHTEFKSSFKGYNKSQVDDFVSAASDALESVLREKCELMHKVDQLQAEVDRVRKIESAMSDALTLAQKSADEVRASAHKQAELTLKEAENARVQMTIDNQREIERQRADIALLQETKGRFESEFRLTLQMYKDWLEKSMPENLIRSEVA
ncbi:MAG: DivIVA domain-containing protein [Armatimonadetes bacterium]|nr:DivIVA domain-containing protein [Armatimonadota bacterium]